MKDDDCATGPGLTPVFPNLVPLLAGAPSVPEATIRFVLAVCSSYAYGDARSVATIMDRLGMTENRSRMVCESVDALFLTSTAFLIQSKDGRVAILVYRGTPPTSAITWMTDLQVAPVTIPMSWGSAHGEGKVHGGFYRNVRSTRFRVAELIRAAIDGRSVLDEKTAVDHPLEALYVAGHSLGGACAAMFAASLVFEPRTHGGILDPVRAVYTYGAPMIGDPDFADACDAEPFLKDNVIRYVYAHDIVPQTPPTASGSFKHFGREFRHMPNDPAGQWNESQQPTGQLHDLLQLATAPVSLLTSTIRRLNHVPFHASLGDHFPQHYIDALTPDGLRSEFGD
jgi:hypothetical protein